MDCLVPIHPVNDIAIQPGLTEWPGEQRIGCGIVYKSLGLLIPGQFLPQLRAIGEAAGTLSR